MKENILINELTLNQAEKKRNKATIIIAPCDIVLPR